MASRFFVAVLLLVALAGCSGPEETGTDAATPPKGPGPAPEVTPEPAPGPTPVEPTQEESPEPAPAGDLPPTFTFMADVLEGTAPLEVSFELAGEDPEGGALVWYIDLDGDGVGDIEGAALPATVGHSFAAGSHNVTARLSDGKHEVESSLLIVATQAGARQEFTASWLASTPSDCLAEPLLAGTTMAQMAVDPATWGLPYEASFSGGAYVGIGWYDTDDGYLADDAATATATLAGTVPDGAGTAYFYACGALSPSVAYLATGQAP